MIAVTCNVVSHSFAQYVADLKLNDDIDSSVETDVIGDSGTRWLVKSLNCDHIGI